MSNQRRPTILQRAFQITLQNYGVAAIIAVIALVFVPWWLQKCFLYLGGVVFLSSLVAPFVDDWRPKARVSVREKAVFITGCDSGFGYSLAQRLDDLGLHVFAGCLLPEKEGAQTLKKSCSERLHVVPLDVTSEESVQSALQYVKDNIGSNKLWAVVNNAGLNAGGEMAWTTLDIMKNIFDVNTFGVMRVTKAFIPLLCKDKGRIVTVASAAGRYTYPGLVPYCMTKQSTVSFCEGLRLELYRFGVKVITIEPWMYRTPITNKDNINSYIAKAWQDSPDDVKELYPEDYLQRFLRGTEKFLKFSISDKPQEVVNCMEEAIMAFDPKYAYNPGTTYIRTTHWLVSRLPKPIADLLIHDECVVLVK